MMDQAHQLSAESGISDSAKGIASNQTAILQMARANNEDLKASGVAEYVRQLDSLGTMMEYVGEDASNVGQKVRLMVTSFDKGTSDIPNIINAISNAHTNGMVSYNEFADAMINNAGKANESKVLFE